MNTKKIFGVIVLNTSDEYIIDFVKGLAKSDDIDLGDFPDMDLYMEQVLNFVDTKLNHLKRNEDDKVFTSSMINNYTKAGILMTPHNRKYGKDHLILLTIVFYLKQTLSIKDIKSLFEPILKDMSTSEDDVISLQKIYSKFVDVKKGEYERLYEDVLYKFETINDGIAELELEDEEEKSAQLFITVITLLAQANAKKLIAEKIIDKYFRSLGTQDSQ